MSWRTPSRRVFDQQVAQQGKKRLRFVLRLGEEQLFGLIDRQDQRRRLGLGIRVQRLRRRLFGERLQERLELYGTGLDDRAQVGPRYQYLRHRKRIFERSKQPGLARDCRPLRPDDRQRQKIPVVALEPWKQAGAKKR